MKIVKDKIKLTNLDKIRYFESGWIKCKERVLEILNRPYSSNINDLFEDRIKEIKNL